MNNYISRLRQLTGPMPLVLGGACVALFDSQHRLLLQHRSDNLCWGLPGGILEPGETVAEAARRETLEETGLTVGALTLLGVYSGPRQYCRYPNGDEVYHLAVTFMAREYTGTLSPDGEGLALAFFPLDQLPSPINAPDQPIIEDLVARDRQDLLNSGWKRPADR